MPTCRCRASDVDTMWQKVVIAAARRPCLNGREWCEITLHMRAIKPYLQPWSMSPPSACWCVRTVHGCLFLSPRCSGASATLWPAPERFFASPCPPTNIVSGAGRLSEVFTALLARLPPAGLPETAPPTLRRTRRELVGSCGLWRGARRAAARERAVGRVWR